MKPKVKSVYDFGFISGIISVVFVGYYWHCI